jgi:hypothetical protein
MEFPQDQIIELREFGPVSIEQEGAVPYLRIQQLQLPAGCTPERCDVLLCPVKTADGYCSKLYFSEKIQTASPLPIPLNWQAPFFILGQNWHSFSWQLLDGNLGLSPAQKLSMHLKPLRTA